MTASVDMSPLHSLYAKVRFHYLSYLSIPLSLSLLFLYNSGHFHSGVFHRQELAQRALQNQQNCIH